MRQRHRGPSQVPRTPVHLDLWFRPLSSNERGYQPRERNWCEMAVGAFPSRNYGTQQQYVLEQLNHTLGKCRIAARVELELVELWIEVVVIHK
jgi:hypothetical protein